MECNHQSPVPSNSNRERASNIQGALTPEEVLSQEGYGPNNQLVISYHRRYPDGEYVPGILSPGFRFCPEDDELIVDYLNKEINKEQAPYIRIPKVNVYKYTPEELAESHKSMGKDEWYFFSPRDRKYLNGNRPNRAAGNGYWKATAADKKIYRNGEYVGSKKSLVFYRGNPQKGNKTNWIMKEYMADQPRRQRLPNGADDMRLDDCVLCRIYKKSKYSPKEETEAAAFESGETVKPAAPKRVKTEHEGTNQQHNLPVLQPNRQMILQPSPTPQQNLQELQPNLSMPQQNQQAMQCSLQPWTNNLGGQLHFSPESNPEEAQPIMPQPNLPSPQQNQQAIMQYSQQPWSYNLGGQLDFCPESNPEEAQPIMLQPNLPWPQQNLQATQCSLQAGSGGQLDFPMASISEEANQFHFGNLGNSHEPFDDLISTDTDGNLTHPPVFPNGFGFDDFYPLSSMFFDPIPPSLDNNDHPQNG